MAPALTPGRKKQLRQNQFFDIGVQGRKTGITLKENERDEHGIENLDGMFSSPEKSPPQRPVRNGNNTLTSSSMQMAMSSELEPTQVLSERRLLKSTRTTLPPPAGRSPYKTNIGSSPRRQSSAAPTERMLTTTPEVAKSRPALKRKLDFLTDEPQPSIEASPAKEPIKGPLYATRNTAKTRVNPYDLQPSPSVGSKKRHQPDMGDDARHSDEEDPFEYHAHIYDNGDDEMTDPNFYVPAEEDPPVSSPIKEPPKKKGRKSGDSEVAIDPVFLAQQPPSIKPHTNHAPDTEFTESEEPTHARASQPSKKGKSTAPKRQTKREPKRQLTKPSDDPNPPTETSTQPDSTNRQQLKKRGRAPKSSKPAVTKKAEKPKPSISNPMPPAQPLNPTGTSALTSRSQSPSKRPSGRSLTILREGMPIEDPSIRRTRSGRQILRPLEYWLGEKAELSRDGSIVGVLRAENVDVPAPAKSHRARSVGRERQQVAAHVTVNEGGEREKEEVEEWEAEGGVIRGLVRAWDAAMGEAVEDDEMEQDLAFSSNSIETRDVAGSDFKYAKFMSLPFFGCGMVDLPPGGFKRAKNARKMQMVFFVHMGKVLVRVGDAEFTISRGGVWHVPRGNLYSIDNKWDRPARIFFAQGCETFDEDVSR